MRWPFFVASGVLIGGVLHIVSLLAVPALAPRDAFSRIGAMGPVNAIVLLEGAGAERGLPFLDPAFVHAACRFDVSASRLSLRVPLAGDYVSMSFHGRDGVAFFSLNDRSALGTLLDVDLRAETADAPRPGEIRAGTIPVTSPQPTGLVLIRAFAPSPSARKMIGAELAKAVCTAVE